MAWILSLIAAVSAFQARGVLRRLRQVGVAVACAGVGALLVVLLIVLHAFHAFAGETLVAWVTTERVAPGEFSLTYTPVSGEEQARTFRLRGDQWAISGGIVKWHQWLTALGLQSYHRPIRISGQFSQLAQQRNNRPVVEALEPGTDRFWEWLYRASPYLPFVEAAYGSSAYVYVEPDWVQEVYVTPSGYLIQRLPKSLRPATLLGR